MIISDNTITSDNNFRLYDFGRDAYARLIITADSPGTPEVAIGECVRDGRLNRAPGGSRFFTAAAIPVTPGKPVYFPIPEHVAPEPHLPKCMPPPGGEIAPFRYVEITGYDGHITLERQEIHAPFDDSAADFECDNDNLNRIWQFCKYSIKATTPFGIYVDGNRERLAYEADSYINQLGHFCCDANFSIAHNTIERLLVHPTWPTEWRLIMPVLARDYMLYSGDTATPKAWCPKLATRLLPEMRDDDGLVHGTGNIKDIIDWPRPERDNYVFGDGPNLVPNCYLFAALNAMTDISGDNTWRTQAEALKLLLRTRFMRDGLFIDNPETTHSSLHSQIFAVAAGVADPSDYPRLAPFIQSRGMACSVYGAQFLLNACYKMGLDDYALSLMTSTSLRSWNNMLNKGATITMEAWDDSFKPNQDWNHAWGAAPANIIPRYLCGLRPTSPGFATYAVKPHPGTIRNFYLRQPTPRGSIEIFYENGKLYSSLNTKPLNVKLP